MQRAELARVIIVPKVLYVARHEWPSLLVTEELQQVVNHFVWGTTNGVERRAWMGAEHTELSGKEGGLGISNVRLELHTLATTAVARWANNSTTFERMLEDIMLSAANNICAKYVTPQFTLSSDGAPISATSHPESFRATGVNELSWVQSQQLSRATI